VEDFGEEVALGGDLGEVRAEHELHPEDPALVRGASWQKRAERAVSKTGWSSKTANPGLIVRKNRPHLKYLARSNREKRPCQKADNCGAYVLRSPGNFILSDALLCEAQTNGLPAVMTEDRLWREGMPLVDVTSHALQKLSPSSESPAGNWSERPSLACSEKFDEHNLKS
jgi:hypothetical protein